MDKPLIQYLSHLRKLEATIYTDDLLIASLSRKAQGLGRARKVDERKNHASLWLTDHTVAASVLCLSALAFSWRFLYKLFWNALEEKYIAPSGGYYYAMTAEDRSWDALWTSFAFGAVVAVGVLGILFVISIIHQRIQQKALNKEYAQRYQAAANKEQARVHDENRMKAVVLAQIESVKKQKAAAEQARDKLYGMNILPVKYRGLIPVSSFCEYLQVGRCESLTGHEGAYNIYELERRMNMIITQLKDINTKLDQIRDNQYALYEVVTQANNRLGRIESVNNRMMNTMTSIRDNTELIAYNTEASAIATRATGEYLVMRDLLIKP